MDILIKNATVVSSSDIFEANICIKGGKIIDLVQSQKAQSLNAFKIIDARGKLVMPGGIDVHTHLDMPFMGTFSTDDFTTGTIAAAFGGTTSIIDYVIPKKNQRLSDALDSWKQKALNKSFVDYGFHMAIVPPAENSFEEFEFLVNHGITSIKCFLAYKDKLMIDDESLFKLLKKAKKHGILVCVHAENGNVIDVLVKDFLKQRKTDPFYHALSRPSVLEAESVSKVLKFSKLLDCPVYFVHLSTKEAMEEIIRSRKAGVKIYAETCPQYVVLTDELYHQNGFEAAKYVMSPPLRSKTDRDFLAECLDKHIDVIATDHCPFNFSKEKRMGKDDFTKIPNGIPGLETRLSVMFNEMVNKKDLCMTKFVKLNSTLPAKIFGIEAKGDIKPNYDADICIWDKDLNWKIHCEKLHHNVDYTPFEGYELRGKPETVILRGNILIENNQIKEKKFLGSFIHRKKLSPLLKTKSPFG